MYVLCVMPPHVHILCIRTRTISIKQRTLLFKRSSIHNRVDKIDSDFTIFEGIIMCQREEKNFFFLLILSFWVVEHNMKFFFPYTPNETWDVVNEKI